MPAMRSPYVAGPYSSLIPCTLRGEPLDHPMVPVAATVSQPVVQPVLASHPELDGVGSDPVAAPKRRQRHVLVGVLGLQAPVLVLQHRPVGDDAALARRPR